MPVGNLSKKRPGHHYSVDILVLRTTYSLRFASFFELFNHDFTYYITTPLIIRFIESNFKLDSITIMVQEEVAKRLVAKAGTEDYSSITLAVAAWGNASITRTVSKQMFFPAPKVDSAVVRIDRVDGKLKGVERKKLNRLVRASFAMRRKTLANNLSAAYAISKDEASKRIIEAGFEPTIRGEKLSLDDYLNLSKFF